MRFLAILSFLLVNSVYSYNWSGWELSCSKQGDKPYFFPQLNDTNKYYQCSNGVAILMSCPKNLWFNPMKKACDWKTVKCKPSVKFQHLPDPNDYRKFYNCFSGVKKHMTCFYNSYYHPFVEACAYYPIIPEVDSSEEEIHANTPSH